MNYRNAVSLLPILTLLLGFLVGYWMFSGSGHWVLINSGSTGSTQAVGIFQTRHRCNKVLENYKEILKTWLEKPKVSSDEENKRMALLEQEGIVLFQSGGFLGWTTISCVKLEQSLLSQLLFDFGSRIEKLESRVEETR